MNNVIELQPHAAHTRTIESGKVGKRYSDVRAREHLTPEEVAALMKAARDNGRHGHRDSTLIMLAFRHGLRVSELISLRWSAVDLKQGTLYVARLKGSIDAVHPLRGPEIRALRRLQRDYAANPYVFTTERKGPLTASNVRKMVARAGTKAGLGFPVHPHQLRHACGYYLANRGIDTRSIQAYLGHASISNTVRYTNLSTARFNDFWSD